MDNKEIKRQLKDKLWELHANLDDETTTKEIIYEIETLVNRLTI